MPDYIYRPLPSRPHSVQQAVDVGYRGRSHEAAGEVQPGDPVFVLWECEDKCEKWLRCESENQAGLSLEEKRNCCPAGLEDLIGLPSHPLESLPGLLSDPEEAMHSNLYRLLRQVTHIVIHKPIPCQAVHSRINNLS